MLGWIITLLLIIALIAHVLGFTRSRRHLD